MEPRHDVCQERQSDILGKAGHPKSPKMVKAQCLDEFVITHRLRVAALAPFEK
jgi:hypothetical protein